MSRQSLCSALLLLCLASPLAAQQPAEVLAHHADDMSVAFRFGTLGLGGEVNKLLASHFGLRLGGNYFSLSATRTQTKVTYAATLKLHDFSALLDLYPFGRGTFHLSGGIMTDPLAVSATGQPDSGKYRIGDSTYAASRVGTLSADLGFPSVRPYFGVGFGTPATMGGALKFLFDLGAVVAKPTLTLNATGAATDPSLATQLQTQQAKTQHDVRRFLKVYPVLEFGLAYRF